MLNRRPDTSPASRAVRGWVREAFAVDPDTPVVVAELRCEDPGCPDVETAIGILDAGGGRRFLLPGPVTAVGRADVEALAAATRGVEGPYDIDVGAILAAARRDGDTPAPGGDDEHSIPGR